MTRSPLALVGLAVALSVSACSGPAAPPVGEPAAEFRVEAPPVWTTDGVRIAAFNGEFLFDGVGDEGEATFPWKGDPAAARAHRDAVGAVVRSLDADVVVMPETENLAALQMLADESLAGMGYTAVLVDGRDTFTGQDVGMLTRLPVESFGRTDERAPVGVSDQLYGVSKNLWVRMDLGGTPVTVIGVHFLARPDDTERRPRREAQAEVIRQLVEAEHGRRPPDHRAGRPQRLRRRRARPRGLAPDLRRARHRQARRPRRRRRPAQRAGRRAPEPNGLRRSTTATATT